MDTAPPPSEPQPLPVVTMEQLSVVRARAEAILGVVQELATITQLVEAHNLPGLLGELKAAFNRLAAGRQS